MRNVYELRGVTKVYQQAALLVRALDGIDLAVAPGEFLVVEGPSGSGKSTLLQLLGGLDRASEGELVFEGNDLGQMGDVDLSDLRLRAFGFIFQQFNLIPTLTARENVEVALAPMGRRPHERRRRAADLLAQVGLADRGPHLPSQLSGGEQQRVAIARALANEPRVVLADEPTGNLDSRTGDALVALLASLAVEHGHTVVLITHDRAIADRAPRVIHLRDGRLAQAGDEVARPAQPAGAPAAPLQVMAGRAASTMLRWSGLEEPVDSGHGLAAASPRTGDAQAPNGDEEPLVEIDLRDRQGAEVRAPTPWWVAPATEADPRPVILRVEQVRKNYIAGETEVEALRGINLEVRQGEYVAVVGPSGCGKTTLLNCLSGLDAIDGGRVLLEGQTLHELPDAERARARATSMGFVFQAYNLVPVFTAAENVELPLLVAGAPPGEARQRAVETLTRVGLGHRVNHRPLQLSGGEQQRVTIARALVGEPRIIWADEPTGNLDSATAASVIELLRQLHLEGMTLVLVTHDAGIAAQAGRRVKMADGRVVSDETTGIAPRPPTGIAGSEAQGGGEVVSDDATDFAPARLIDITAAEAQAGLSLPDSTGRGAGSAWP